MYVCTNQKWINYSKMAYILDHIPFTFGKKCFVIFLLFITNLMGQLKQGPMHYTEPSKPNCSYTRNFSNISNLKTMYVTVIDASKIR